MLEEHGEEEVLDGGHKDPSVFKQRRWNAGTEVGVTHSIFTLGLVGNTRPNETMLVLFQVVINMYELLFGLQKLVNCIHTACY